MVVTYTFQRCSLQIFNIKSYISYKRFVSFKRNMMTSRAANNFITDYKLEYKLSKDKKDKIVI